MSDAGYATALVGKWHLGSHEGRLPNDQGFDEWFGSPRTTNESQWSSQVGWSAETAPVEQILEGRKGEPSRNIVAHDIEQRRLIDARDHPPFFLYITVTQPTTLTDVARIMNDRPRKILGWNTPAEAMAEELAAIKLTVALQT